jgi:hypothetical protein
MGGVMFGQLDDLLNKAKAHLPKNLHAELTAEVQKIKGQVAAQPASEAKQTQAP